jgi:site-specific DNA recombinase
VRVALYARVSSEAQEARGTIGSQLQVLRARIAERGDELVAEFCDDGYSGARLDRPGLDLLRDQAEAGPAFEAVWCLSPDRLARAYAYQVLVLDELAQFGVRVLFSDAPSLEDDPQTRLLTQVQGVIAEYERCKIAERNRRGRLFRARSGEVVAWKAPYGYRRVPRSGNTPARLEIYEPEAAVVRRIYDDYVAGGHSIRHIMRALNAEQIPTPTGKTEWWHSTLCRILSNEAYVGRVYFNQTETLPTASTPTHARRRGTTQRRRPREEWIEISCPRILDDAVFEAAQRVSRDNSKWSPRNLHEQAWLLRGLVRCGSCDVCLNSHKLGATTSKIHRYYTCRNKARSGVPGQTLCPERSIRADALDAFVFEQVKTALLRPTVLCAGQAAVRAAAPSTDDELLATELDRLARKLDANRAERRRTADLYQSGLLDLTEVQRRAHDVDQRHDTLLKQRDELIAHRQQLAVDNRLQHRVGDFARRAAAGIDKLNFAQRQQLLRLIVDHVNVTGWRVEIHLRIPLDDDPGGPTHQVQRRPDYGRRCHTTRPPAPGTADPASAVSSKDGLRSLRRFAMAQVGAQPGQASLDIDAVAIPAQDGAHGETVPCVVDAGPAPVRAWREPGAAQQARERLLNGPVDQPSTRRGHEETRRRRRTSRPVAQRCVAAQRIDGAGMKCQLPALRELGVPDDQHAVVPVEVIAVESNQLCDPGPGHHQQCDQCFVGGRPQGRGE